MTTITAATANIATATVTIALEIEALIHLRADLSGLATLHAECNSVREARELLLAGYRPMWPAIPRSEQATHRGTDAVYLYFYWPRNRHDGRYAGPNGARKTYLGCKAENIALARDMVRSRRHFLSLRTAFDATASAIRRAEQQTTSAGHTAAAGRLAAEAAIVSVEQTYAA